MPVLLLLQGIIISLLLQFALYFKVRIFITKHSITMDIALLKSPRNANDRERCAKRQIKTVRQTKKNGENDKKKIDKK